MHCRRFAFFIFLLWMQAMEVGSDRCTYENCAEWKKDMLNVHLICHSHQDPGWLKTVDQCFWGSNQRVNNDGAQYILDSLVSALQQNPERKFSYGESSFLWRWMLTKDEERRQQLVKQVKNGQFEFTNGGWAQNDEAAGHYSSIIDQMTTGHRYLNSTFGRCGIPKTGWQIDPFGHSREAASLFAQMGLEGVFFARIHYIDRDARRREKSMEMLWQGSDDLGNSSDIFTHAFYDHYNSPPGFCFDEKCDDEPIMDDPRLEEFNVDQRITQFIDFVQQQAKAYQTNHILLTMGDDFQYMNAERNYANLDKLIKYVNEKQSQGSKVHTFYSTPACYIKAVKDAGIKLGRKTDDFFPYATEDHSYLTGFFTSRPALKGAERQGSNMLQACQAMDALGDLSNPPDSGVDVLHQSLGIMQHHDAITGTARQHVTNDYHKLLHNGFLACQQIFNDALAKLAPKSKGSQPPPYQTFCFNLNASACNVSQDATHFITTVYNALAQPLNTFLRIPVSGPGYMVYDPQGQSVTPQVIKTFITKQVPDKEGPYDLIFPITIPGIGYSTYYVSQNPTAISFLRQSLGNSFGDKKIESTVISNDFLRLEFDPDSGLLKSVVDMGSGKTLAMKQNFYWYRGASEGGRYSNAYVFCPNGTTPFQVATGKVTLERIEGPYVQEMRQIFADWLTQTVRLYKNKPYAEFEWTVGPIPSADKISKEVINRFDTTIASDKTFWTDSNGRQIVKRIRNYQPTYPYKDSEPIAANYYPVTTSISIRDANLQVAVLTDRAQGGSSTSDGSVELMIHRRLFEDDGGLIEPLNEPGTDGRGLVIRGKHWLLVSEPSKSARLHRQYALEMFHQPVLTFAPFLDKFEDYRSKFNTLVSAIKLPTPQNVNFLSLAQWQSSTMLLRMEHLYQKDEDTELSKPVSISIMDHLSAFDILSIEELGLSGNPLLHNQLSNFIPINDTITLQPMQIRTFRCVVKNKIAE